MQLTRDDFDNISIEEFEDLKEQNDTWTQGDLSDIQEYLDNYDVKDYDLYRTNNPDTIYLIIVNDDVQFVTKQIQQRNNLMNDDNNQATIFAGMALVTLSVVLLITSELYTIMKTSNYLILYYHISVILIPTQKGSIKYAF